MIKPSSYYRIFYNGDHQALQATKQGSGNEIRIIKTKNSLESFDLQYFETSNNITVTFFFLIPPFFDKNPIG